MAPCRLKGKCSAISETRRFSKKEAKETDDDVQNEVMSEMEEEEAGRIWDHLPYEVVVEILLRLPVKSVGRCRCVCKDWHSLISSDTFITTHTNRTVSRSHDKNMSSLLVVQYSRNPFHFYGGERIHHFLSLCSRDVSIGYNDNFFKPRSQIFDPHKIVASGHGLLCCTIEILPIRSYVLRNPFIGKHLSLPAPNFTDSTHGTCVDIFGLGYDPSSNDIKLVRLVYPHQEQHSKYGKVPPLVEIYTLKSGCWRHIPALAPPYVINRRRLSVFVNGASHWMAHSLPSEGTFRNVILAFDMGHEVFREIALPKCYIGKQFLKMTLVSKDGLLCLVPDYPSTEEQNFSIWIMKEYGIAESWIKLFDIPVGLGRVVGFRKNGEVFIIDESGVFLSYEPKAQLLTDLGFCPNPSIYAYHDLWHMFCFWEKYKETILMLNVKSESQVEENARYTVCEYLMWMCCAFLDYEKDEF